jgi:hypothetical protein
VGLAHHGAKLNYSMHVLSVLPLKRAFHVSDKEATAFSEAFAIMF